MKWEFKIGDAQDIIPELDENSIQCIITSPPYWGGIRDYKIPPSIWPDGWKGCLGNEDDPEMYVKHLCHIFELSKRIIKPNGTTWLNIGDSYSNDNELMGIPWMVAFEMRKKGWRIIKDIIWKKPNPPPQNTNSRPVSSHEHIFIFSISKSHYYNPDGVRIPHSQSYIERAKYPMGYNRNRDEKFKSSMRTPHPDGRLIRDVWEFVTAGGKEIHPAVFPEELPKRCILLGSQVGDWILDPFVGSGTTIKSARNLQRNSIGIDINPEYKKRAIDKSLLNIPDIQDFVVSG